MDTPEFLVGGYYNTHYTPEKCHSDNKAGDHFVVEDLLLDVPNDEDDAIVLEGGLDTVTGIISTDSSPTVTVVDSCNSSVSGSEPHFSRDVGCGRVTESQFSGDLCVPLGN
ncbi:uncharacterized protein LOC132305259 [Cornus florida]|uniref:uncharacterized protein LOC132305259 n=1 Tax=Cornus florida TaxID=4283 RepID=UPI00289B78B2|nr:uncharacterized protein LOC132305259 [Cornus florida]